MDPSVLLKSTWRAQWPDPVEDRKKLLTLRDLMDQRRIREQQYQLQQQTMQEHQRKLADDERYRQALTGGIPADLTLDEAVRRYGPQGFDVYNSIRTSRTAEDTAKTATLTRQQKEAELVRKRMQDRADVLYSVQGQGQPATDEAVMMDLLKPENQRLGLGKIGQETPLALTEPQLRAQYSEAYSPTQWQALKKGEADAKAADLKQDEEQFKAAYPHLTGANDQDSWTAAIKTLPVRLQPLIPPRFNAANKQKALSMWIPAGEAARMGSLDSPDKVIQALNQPGLPQDERDRLTAQLNQMVKYRQDVRPVTVQGDVSGLVSSVLKNPATYAGLPGDTKAAILPALTAAGFQPPPSADFQKQVTAVKNIRDAVSQYRTHLSSYDRLMRPGTPEYATMTTAYRNLLLRMKEAFNLGVLNGPDLQLLTETLGDPASWAGRYAGKETLTSQLDEYEKILNSNESVLRGTYNQPAASPDKPTGAKPAPGDIPNPLLDTKKPTHRFNPTTGKLEVTTR